MRASLEALIELAASGRIPTVVLLTGDRVLTEPAALRLAEAAAGAVGCSPEVHRRPPTLARLLADLQTYPLFAAGKVVVVVDSAVVAAREAAADLIDEAAEGVSGRGVGSLGPREREAAGRLLQALRLFAIDPAAGPAEEVLGALPLWAFQGGRAARRARSRKQAEDLRAALAPLLEAAREEGLHGWAEGDLAELAAMVGGGLPPGHVLILAESAVAEGHPVVQAIEDGGARVDLGAVAAARAGWEGLDPLARELGRETGAEIEPGALAALARRTLRSSGGKERRAEADSTARFAAEYRKLAALSEGRQIGLALVEEAVTDRGAEDVWAILDAAGDGRAGEALDRIGRHLSSVDDPTAARLALFGLLASFCRHLTAVSGMMRVSGVQPGERSYPRFQARVAPVLQRELAAGQNPLAGLHPFRLHRAYLAAGRMAEEALASLPWRVLEAELRLKGESTDPDAALAALVADLAAARR